MAELKPKWISIEKLEENYYRALGIELKPRVPWDNPEYIAVAQAHNEAHHQFCLDASEGGLSGALKFQGKAGDAKMTEAQMGLISETHFRVTRGFEDNVIMPFSYGLPIDEQSRQRNSNDPYFHDAIVERRSAERWLEKLRSDDAQDAAGKPVEVASDDSFRQKMSGKKGEAVDAAINFLADNGELKILTPKDRDRRISEIIKSLPASASVLKMNDDALRRSIQRRLKARRQRRQNDI